MSIPEAWGFVEPPPILCPCDGEIETCELCDGTGHVIADRPTRARGPFKIHVLESRYAAGLPLWHPGDLQTAWNASSLAAFCQTGQTENHGGEWEAGDVDFDEAEL